MSETFQGFPKDLLKFFEELAQNNDRSWFAANKQRYKDVVVHPMGDFIAAIAPQLDAIAPFYVADPRPTGGSMFRIYRDVRFSKDKKPYKEHVACQFRHQAGKDAHAPGFYLHMEPGNIRFGGGVWTPPSPKLKLIREYMDENQDPWIEITRDPEFKSVFETFRGDSLIRPPKGYDADHPIIDDLKKKSFFIMKQAPDKNILSPKFAEEVANTFQAAVPFMRFLTNAVGLPF